MKEILAVVFFKEIGPGDWRVSMRSKGDIDINAVAKEFGGGGHKNASGCSAHGDLSRRLQAVFEQKDHAPPSSGIRVMDGVLVVDKPQGLTSHDVVAASRRRCLANAASVIPARSIRWPPACCRWHAGAPRGSCGSSSASDKDYEATIRFGVDDRLVRHHRDRDQPIGQCAGA